MTRLRLLTTATLLATLMLAPAGVSAAPAARDSLVTAVPVTGTLENGQPFSGTATITELTRDGSQLLFSGTIQDSTGALAGTFTDVVGTLQQPGGGSTGKCDILFLDLGPIFLDVLGLEVDLSQIVLDINAVPGAGNLLGNLLCAVVGLLDGDPLGGLGALLDRLLDRIGGLLG